MALKDHLDFWSLVAPAYTSFVSQDRQGYAQIQTFARTFLSPQMRVLEVGCGPGNMTQRIASACKEVVATDASEGMIKQARQRVQVENATFEVADAMNLPYADNAFDAVVAFNMLHVIDQPEQLLEEVRRVLVPGGSFIVTSFITGSKRAHLVKLGLQLILGSDHETRTFAEFIDLFRANGWRVHAGRRLTSVFPLAAVVATRQS